MAQAMRQPIRLQASGVDIDLNEGRDGEGADGAGRLHERVYAALCGALIEGQIAPLKPVSLRALAQGLGVSAMPVREAVRRLIAERALELQPSNQRLRVPDMGPKRLAQLRAARIWVEGELAAAACACLDPEWRSALVARLEADEIEVMTALESGDADSYMRANHDFHFSLYKASGCDLWLEMARTLWLQSGPFMRVVFDRLGHISWPKDYHGALIAALKANDAGAVRQALIDDVADGMDLMAEGLENISQDRRQVL